MGEGAIYVLQKFGKTFRNSFKKELFLRVPSPSLGLPNYGKVVTLTNRGYLLSSDRTSDKNTHKHTLHEPCPLKAVKTFSKSIAVRAG